MDKAQEGTGDNHAISALKFKIIQEFLQLGWNVLLSDVDVIVVQVKRWPKPPGICAPHALCLYTFYMMKSNNKNLRGSGLFVRILSSTCTETMTLRE